jgi:hypothetical protein
MPPYKPPKSGDAPAWVKQMLKSVYTHCREQYPGEIRSHKARCARIAWGAVKKAGYKPR